MKKLFIAGNWKMHFTRSEAVELAHKLVDSAKGISHKVMIAVPYTALEAVGTVFKGTNIKLGAQNVSWAPSGAFTGEISVDQLLDLGVEYVLIGHSERRQYFGETDKTVNDKMKTAIGAGLEVVLCVGETLHERESGKEKFVVAGQLTEGLKGLSSEDMQHVTIAYEPVWAIGTGKTATPEQAEEMHAFIRKHIEELYTPSVAGALFLQYGGSVNDKNVGELMSKPNINGALVGGASLKADAFSVILNVKV
jgi:triosephosphate isomerase